MKRNTLNKTIGVDLLAVCAASASARDLIDRTTLPIPGPKFAHDGERRFIHDFRIILNYDFTPMSWALRGRPRRLFNNQERQD
jgi:hypothetical protein